MLFFDEDAAGLYFTGVAFVEAWRLKVASLSKGCRQGNMAVKGGCPFDGESIGGIATLNVWIKMQAAEAASHRRGAI